MNQIEYDTNGGCWFWTGSGTGNGYGLISIERKKILAHRFAWQTWRGEIPSTLEICHRCDVRPCVNPDHLFLGTRQQNVSDMIAKGRKRTKLTAAQIVDVRNRLAAGELQAHIAQRYGVSRRTVGFIKSGETWKHI
jgi:hypothetical protein